MQITSHLEGDMFSGFPETVVALQMDVLVLERARPSLDDHAIERAATPVHVDAHSRRFQRLRGLLAGELRAFGRC